MGDAIVFGVNGGGVAFKQIEDRYASYTENTLENLHHLNLGYFARADWSDQALAQANGYRVVRLPSVGMFATPLSVIYNWGVPVKGYYKSYHIDIRRLSQATVPRQEQTGLSMDQAAAQFNIRTGLKNSYLEGSIFEEIFGLSKGVGLSAVALLIEASANGAPVYQVSPANLAAFEQASTGLSLTTREQISQYVSLGYEVTAPAQPIDAVNWNSEGYIAIDPQTGSGAYIIASGSNGGELIECEPQVKPITQTIGNQIQTLLLLAAIAALIALIPWTLGGSAVPAGQLTVILMASMGMTFLTFSAPAYAGNCPTDKCHRGRFQAQGGEGREYAEISVKWERPTPLTKAEALVLADQLADLLTSKQYAVRADAFSKLKSHISSRPSVGVCSPYVVSFYPSPKLPKGIRVDMEVRAGAAFTD